MGKSYVSLLVVCGAKSMHVSDQEDTKKKQVKQEKGRQIDDVILYSCFDFIFNPEC